MTPNRMPWTRSFNFNAIVLIAAALILTSLGLTGWTVYRSYQRSVEERMGEASRVLEAAEKYVRAQFDSLDAAVSASRLLIGERRISDLDVAELQRIKNQIENPLRDRSIEISFWRGDGRNAIRSEYSADGSLSGEFRKIFERPASSNDRQSSNVTKDGNIIGAPLSGMLRKVDVLPIWSAITDEHGNNLGVISGTIPVSGILDTFKIFLKYPGDTIFLFRSDKIGMVREPYDVRFSGKYLPDALIWQNYPRLERGRFEGSAATDGIRRMGVHMAVKGLPLVLGHSVELKAFDAEFLINIWPELALDLALALLAGAFAWIAYRSLEQAHRNANEAEAERINSIRENTKLSAIMDAAEEGIIILDAAMKIVTFNKAAEELFGYSKSEALRHSVDILIPDDVKQRHAANVREATSGNDFSRTMGNWRSVSGRQKSGKLFPAQISIVKSSVNGESLYMAVVRDMSDIVAAEAKLLQAKTSEVELRVDAEKANKAKSLFLANVTHELRTPLNAILGFGEFIESGLAGPPDSPKYKEYIGDILFSAKHLLALVNNILDTSKLQSGTFVPNLQAVPVLEPLHEAQTLLDMRASEKRLVFDFSGVDASVAVMADRRGLTQVFANLIGNSVKFSPKSGRICVSARISVSPSQIEIVLSDQGPGIAPAILEKIGEPFLQERLDANRNAEGIGLGLSICKDVLTKMHGKISFRNIEPHGLEVKVTLPRAA